MSNDLVASSLTTLPVTATRVDLSEYGSTTSFLPRIQLVGKGKYVDTGKITPGNYGSPAGADITDLGAEVDILPLAVRDKALDTSGETPVAVYDKADPLFADIVKRAGVRDSGCMYGPSLLVFERNTGKFYEWFLGNASARGIADDLNPFMAVSESQAAEFGIDVKAPTPCTISARYVQEKFSWHVPVIRACSLDFTNLPDIEVTVGEVEKFVTATYDGPELATAEDTAGRSR